MVMGSFGFAIAVLVLAGVVVGSVAGIFILGSTCSDQKIPSGDPFFDTVGRMLVDLKQNHEYSYAVLSEGSATAYGRAFCSSLLSWSDSTACLQYAGDNIWAICGNAIDAQVTLAGCYIRYSQNNFF